MQKRPLIFLAILSVFMVISTQAMAAEQYTFGVHPFKSPLKLKKMFSPLATYLSQELGTDVQFRSAKNYDAAMQALVEGKVDFSYMGPAPYAILDEQYPGKIRIAAAVLNKGKPTFNGVIVAKEDSDINSLADLKGKKFAFGDRESTLSCYMPAYMLMEAGVFDSVTHSFLGSHDNVAMGVMKGIFAAGGLKPDVANKYVGKGLKIIATSEPVYEHLVIIGPNVDNATAEKVRQALLKVQDPTVYTSIKGSLTGFTTVSPSDYDNLKAVIKAVDAKMPK